MLFRGSGICPSSSGQPRTVSLALDKHATLKLIRRLTFHRSPHEMIHSAGSPPQSSIRHLSAGQTTTYHQHICRLPRPHPRGQSLIQWLESMARTGTYCLRKRFRDTSCIASPDRQHYAASEERGFICLDCEELLIRRQPWDEVVIDLGDRGLLDQLFVAETVAFGNPSTVVLEEIAGRSKVVFAVSLVDGGGRSGSGPSRQLPSLQICLYTHCSPGPLLALFFFI